MITMVASRRKEDPGLVERLYPVPLSTGVVALPGPTSASSSALLGVLKHNRENHHIFFNEKGYHKYVERFVMCMTEYFFDMFCIKAMPRTICWPYMVLARHPKS
jgi:hypothetical protein